MKRRKAIDSAPGDGGTALEDKEVGGRGRGWAKWAARRKTAPAIVGTVQDLASEIARPVYTCFWRYELREGLRQRSRYEYIHYFARYDVQLT
jgi:hypothetical protein